MPDQDAVDAVKSAKPRTPQQVVQGGFGSLHASLSLSLSLSVSLSLSIYIYIYIYVVQNTEKAHIYIYIYTYIHTHTHTLSSQSGFPNCASVDRLIGWSG